jgi:cell division protein FtsQ
MATRRRNRRRSAPVWRRALSGIAARLQAMLRSAVALLALATLVAVAMASLDALRAIPVERIVVMGKLEHLRQAAVRDALGAQLDRGLLFLDLSELRDRLEAIPWVYRAELRRRFPDTIEVRVQEQVPIARWGADAFLNHEARVISVVDAAQWAELPEIRGPEGSAPRLMTHYRRLRLDLAPLGLLPVGLEEDAFGQLRVALDNGVTLQLGDHDFRQRLQRFAKLWNSELAQIGAPVARVDLRYEKGAAVAFAATAQLAGLSAGPQDR